MELKEVLAEPEFRPKKTKPTVKINSALHTYIMLELSKRGLSQTLVAKMCGCSVQFINLIITGRRTSTEIQNRLAINVLGHRNWNHLVWCALKLQDTLYKNFTMKGEDDAM